MVLATHNETSILKHSRPRQFPNNTDTLLLVDAVSSIGAMDIRTDEWHVDLMVTGSQRP